MKTFNTKLIVALFTTLVLTGCMPDSLTKFKKDPPKKAASTATDDNTTPPITDGSGNAVDPNTLMFPTKFYFGNEGVPAEDAFQVNTAITALTPLTDGTLADPATRNIIFLGCILDTSGAVITRTLPPGLTLNQSTCSITGTPTTIYSDTTPGNVGGKITYTVRMFYKGASYTGVGTESSLSAAIRLAIYDVPTAFNMTQNEKLQIKLVPKNGGVVSSIQANTDSLVNYNRYGVLTSSGKNYAGIIKYVDPVTSTVGVYRVQPLVVGSTIPFSVNGFVSTSGNAKRGKILSINTTTKTIYVEALTANTIFAVGDALDNATSFLAAESTIAAVDSSYKFSIGAKVDNDSQYFTEKFNIEGITQTYERGVTIQPISPILSNTILPANGIIYGISPALPDGLSFSETTGIISGVFNNTLDATVFTISAYNDLGESNYSVSLAAINSPKDLSYTSRQLITVGTNTPFLEGEGLFQPIAAPALTSVSAKVLRKVSNNKLSIETFNGNFLAPTSLDSGNAYYSEKSTITPGSTPQYYNIALSLSDASAFAIGQYISTPPRCLNNTFLTQATCVAGSSTWYATGAMGRIIDKDANTLYIQFLTPAITSPTATPAVMPLINTFTENDNVDNVYPYVGPEAFITQVEAANMSFRLTSIASFGAGHDISSDFFNSGYVYATDAANNMIKVDEINRTGALGVQAVGSDSLRVGHNLDNKEYYSSAVQAIQQAGHDALIVIDRGVPRTVYANVSQGTSLLYSISPVLPDGLTLNPTTGVISGTAIVRVPKKTFVVTANNLLGSAYYAFEMEVRDYFTFGETSKAKSFVTHKVGDFRASRGCRINATDILNGNSAALDIGCNIEAEEQDLYYTDLKFTAMVGAGTCEYVGYTPYALWQYQPIKTKRVIDVVSACTGGPAGALGAAPMTSDYCLGDYKNQDGPNCDTGSLTVVTYSSTTSGGPCNLTATSTLACGGRKAACLIGPVTSLLSPANIDAGARGVSVESSGGMKKEWSINSPYKSLDSSNIRTANGLVNNQCTDTRADSIKWANLQRRIASTKSPFGKESPYYDFTCMDSAQDIKARIRVSVRDWDKSFKIKDNITELIPGALLGNMNATGTTPLGISWNNNFDWDDQYSTDNANSMQSIACGSLPGTCSTGPQADMVSCEAVGKTWTNNDTGYCTRPANVTRADCETANETWINTTEGVCTVGARLTKEDCETNPGAGVWTLRDFPYPGSDI